MAHGNSKHMEPDQVLGRSLLERYRLMGATGWKLPQFIALAKTIGCTPYVLAAICGVSNGSKYFRRGRAGGLESSRDVIPGPVCLTASIIKQFMDFRMTGILGPPIIPLDTILESRSKVAQHTLAMRAAKRPPAKKQTGRLRTDYD